MCDMSIHVRAFVALYLAVLSLPAAVLAQKSGGGGVVTEVPTTTRSESADPSFFERLFGNKPAPAPVKRASCGDKPTLKERVTCRLTTDEATLAYESATAYMPEECRALPAGAGKDACVNRYIAFQPCWKMPVGPERVACARKVIGLGSDLKALAKDCAARPVKERQACKTALRDKVFTLIKFRIYDLAERAEEYVGTEKFKAATILFVTNAELSKQTFNKAVNDTQRAKVIESMRLNWRAYAKLTGDADSTAKTMVEAAADLKAVR
jgi:hypothetical protein